MELYIVDNKNLDILSVCKPCNYNLNLDEETNGVSEFVLPELNNAKKGCYMVLNGLYRQFLFVINNDIITEKNQKSINISALDISNIFDRKIILKNKEIMQEEGIERFIADNILENFVNTNDSIFNLNYIDVYIHTNTVGSVTINEDNGLFNFHTFLINCRQYKNIYTEFSINNKRLRIDIRHKEDDTLLIDTTLAEVTGYNKIYEVDPVTKVEAYIREDGSIYNLYLRSDRTTTTEKDDPNRLFGRIETISCDTFENAKEEALNRIKANTYKHLVEFNIAKTSKLIDVTQLYLGRKIKIKTNDSIYDSYISAIVLNDDNFISYKSGNLRIDFTDKQRQEKQNGTAGNKVDVSGGKMTGTLQIEGNVEANNTNIIYVGSNEMWSTCEKNENGTFTIIEAYRNQIYEGIFDNIDIPNGYEKKYRMSAYISTSGHTFTGIAINNRQIVRGSTWSGETFRMLFFSDFFKFSDIPQQKLSHYDGNGYNIQMFFEGEGTGRVYHATLHGYLVKEGS